MSRFLREESLVDFEETVDQEGNYGNSIDDDKLLYVAGLNFTENFFPRNDWNVGRAYEKVKGFVSAAETSGWKLTLFFDDTKPSPEVAMKWKTRRNAEVKEGAKNMPFGFSILVGDMFRACGVEVIYSFETDNDDTLAIYAHQDGASVLSNAKNFFRFTGASFKIYGDYSIVGGRLELTAKSVNDVLLLASARDLLPDKPEVRGHAAHVCENVYKRGVISPLTKALSFDGYGVVTPLLRASFVRNDVTGPITEEWPTWNNVTASVEWHRESNIIPAADDFYLRLLDAPDDAVAHFFPEALKDPVSTQPAAVKHTVDWIKHLLNLRGLVYELCSTEDRTLLDLWLEYEESHPNKGDMRRYPLVQGGYGSGASNGFTDRTLQCRDCHNGFIFSSKDQEFFKLKGFDKPVRCKVCKNAKKGGRY